MPNETRELAKFTASLTYEQLPRRVRGLVLDCVVDQIGCELGCAHLPWAQQVLATYREAGGTPQATVVRYGDKLPMNAAAFVNSVFGHSFEFDDGNTLARGHPGAELIPGILAVAEHTHATGREFLAAFAAAYEVRARVGSALAPDMAERGGPNYSTTCGPFAAAAGAAKLLKLDAGGIRHAIAIAGTYAGGLQQYDHGGGSVKRTICAIGTSNGVQAARLAKAGMTGPEEILEGARGVLRIYSPTYRPERLVEDLGTKWLIELVRFKPYSSCGAIHAAIDGLRKIKTARALKPEDVAAVEVGYAKHNVKHVAVTDPYDLTGMQFSTAYSLALTMLKGRNAPSDYTMEAISDPAMRAFAKKVSIVEDAELSQLRGRLPARVRVRTTSGQVHEECVLDPTGSPGKPLSSANIDEKFRSQVADLVGSEKCETLLKALRSIDSLDDIAKLLPLLVFSDN